MEVDQPPIFGVVLGGAVVRVLDFRVCSHWLDSDQGWWLLAGEKGNLKGPFTPVGSGLCPPPLPCVM